MNIILIYLYIYFNLSKIIRFFFKILNIYLKNLTRNKY
jgi:hypothetical protein